MSIRSILKGAALASVAVVFATGGAMAQQCTETQFGSKTGQIYLSAENELLQKKNPSGALNFLNQLRQQQLNCYEEGAALRLSAAIKVETKDYSGAVRDFETALNKGYIPDSERKNTYFNISQLYLQGENLSQARDYMNKWIQAGGQPKRDQQWTMAVLNQKLGDDRQALQWAEKVFAIDGPNADRSVYDFLIYLYDKTGQRGKKAGLLENLLAKDPKDRKLWDAIAGDYYQGKEERKAFEVQKAMYLGNLLTTEDELMRIVNFYNRFDAPYHAARVLEQEMNKGRIKQSYDKLELLANLYQVAREFERAVPVIEKAAQQAPNGQMYERLARSFVELKQWAKVEDAATKAINKGGLKDAGSVWVMIGQSRYERKDREGAREAFSKAGNTGGRSWNDFLRAEENTAKALACFDVQSAKIEIENEQRVCSKLTVLGGEMPAGCATTEERLAAAMKEIADKGC